jgi:hypothetical protein
VTACGISLTGVMDGVQAYNTNMRVGRQTRRATSADFMGRV